MSKSIHEVIIEFIYELRHFKFSEFKAIIHGQVEEERQRMEIEDYLDDQLNDSDKKEFEAKMKHNRDIRKEVMFRKKINNSINELRYKKELEEAFNKYHKDQKIRKLAVKWSVAACLLLIIGASIFLASQDRKIDKESLYLSYYQPLDKKEFHDLRSDFDEGKEKYFKGDYKGAFLIYSNLPTSIDIKAEKELFTALSLIELGDFQGAINKLNENLKTNKRFAGYSYWYLGLCYLKTNQLNSAKEVFGTIAESKGYNSKKAAKILRKLS